MHIEEHRFHIEYGAAHKSDRLAAETVGLPSLDVAAISSHPGLPPVADYQYGRN